MNSLDPVRAICNLPNAFRDGTKSPYELVHQTGIDLTSLDVDAIRALLAAAPELVTAWLHWSEDKRSSPGYYFTAEGDHYVVGRYPSGERLEFRDAITACADFIVKEVKSIW